MQLFDISAYAQRSDDEPGSDANARLLLDELKVILYYLLGTAYVTMHHLLTYHGPYEPNAVWTHVVTNLLAYILTCLLTCSRPSWTARRGNTPPTCMSSVPRHAPPPPTEVRRRSGLGLGLAPALSLTLADGGPSPRRSGLGFRVVSSLHTANRLG